MVDNRDIGSGSMGRSREIIMLARITLLKTEARIIAFHVTAAFLGLSGNQSLTTWLPT